MKVRNLALPLLLALTAAQASAVVAHYNFGQLGSNPIYLGALPPAFTVEIRRADNSAVYSGGVILANYTSSSGELHFTLPSSVNGSFRVYLRFPYQSDPFRAGYLAKLYPAMNQFPLPPDTTFIPMQTLIQGDCNQDNVVDIGDYAVLSQSYEKAFDDPGFDPRADITGDQFVDIGDYALLSSSYGLFGDD